MIYHRHDNAISIKQNLILLVVKWMLISVAAWRFESNFNRITCEHFNYSVPYLYIDVFQVSVIHFWQLDLTTFWNIDLQKHWLSRGFVQWTNHIREFGKTGVGCRASHLTELCGMQEGIIFLFSIKVVTYAVVGLRFTTITRGQFHKLLKSILSAKINCNSIQIHRS